MYNKNCDNFQTRKSNKKTIFLSVQFCNSRYHHRAFCVLVSGLSAQEEEGGAQNCNSWWQKAPEFTEEVSRQQHSWDRGGTNTKWNGFRLHIYTHNLTFFAANQTCLDQILLFSLQVNMIKDDGTVIHFNNPKVQASLSANTFAITGHAETKQLTEMLPGILSQLGADSLSSLRKLAEHFPRQGGSIAVDVDQ